MWVSKLLNREFCTRQSTHVCTKQGKLSGQASCDAKAMIKSLAKVLI